MAGDAQTVLQFWFGDALPTGERSIKHRPKDGFPGPKGGAPWGQERGATGGRYSLSCSKRHITLPEPDLGRLSANCTIFGTL